jgi:hypothetical protein
MKIQRTYGLALPDALAVRAPPMPRFRGFGGEWEDWCDANDWTPENNAKCKNCNIVNIPILGPRCTYPAPHTQAGRVARGLPMQTDLQRLGPPPSDDTEEPGAPIPEVGDSWFEKNKTVLLVGGGALALAAVFALKGRGRRMNGFMGFGKRRRKSRRKARRN